MADWQPIETAPKDGEVILIFTPGTYPQVTAAFYRAECELQHWQATGHRWHFPEDPTHWMPLPEPPHHQPEEQP